MSDVALPEPVAKEVWVGAIHLGDIKVHTADQMRAHAAAVSAAETRVLKAHNTSLQIDVIAPLQARVKVLEDALRVAFKWGGGLTVAEGEQIRAALGSQP
jgi:hypothetical protein